jgi:DNA polymerase-3 subunit gamma/tau
MSLYRKHRPQQFSDIVGQEHIKTTLANALRQGSFSHAYIFAGPKGSGKTTTARLLAKALNCTGRDITKSIEPCEKCTSCVEITAGRSMDVMEIDAASNRGIDEMRDLREKINFAPTSSQYKVYVIDECHMLTKEAFNALLKTLEEPPKHAVFILATTELHKVPATILSRAQLFDFKKAKIDEVMCLLESVAKKEKIKIEHPALQLVARLAYGAYRDALTLLDQVASIATDKEITLLEVQQVLGQATEQSVWDLVEALAQKDRSAGLKVINDVYFEGKDLAYFVGEVTELLRKIILMQSGLSSHYEVSAEEKVKIEALAKSFSSEEIVLTIQKLSTALPQVKASVLGQLPLEMVVFELTQENQNVKIKVENDNVKIKNEEKAVESVENKPLKSDPVIESKPLVESKPPKVEEATAPEPEVKVVKMIDSTVAQAWLEIVKRVKRENNVVAAMLREAVVRGEDDGTLTLGVANNFNAKQLCNATIRPVIESAILEIVGKNLRIDCQVDGAIKNEKPAEAEEELLANAKEIFEDI